MNQADVVSNAIKSVNDVDQDRIANIVDRAVALAEKHDVELDPLTMNLDLMVVHSTVPLRLEELEKADDGNFAHDVFGIRRHLNRDTGILEDCFMPRFAV